MSKRTLTLSGAAIAALAALSAATLAQEANPGELGAPGDWADAGPGLGVAATPEEVEAVDISIQPDGRNLPAGQGTVAEGEIVFQTTCASCHGERGAGGDGMIQLTGGIGTIATAEQAKTVASFWPYATTVFDYVRRAMPLYQPQTLTNEEVYAVTAYLLSIDGIVAEDAVMNAETLPAVVMPNRDGFVSWWPMPEDPTP